MLTYTLGSHNCWFELEPEKFTKDLEAGNHLSIRGLQEANRFKTQILGLRGKGYGVSESWPLPIVWDKKQFSGSETSNLVLAANGVSDVKHEPPRFVSQKVLTHLETKKKLLILNVHCLRFQNPHLDHYQERQSDAQNYWLKVVELTVKAQQRVDIDAVHLVGDFNVNLVKSPYWYYPAQLLNSVYLADSVKEGFDHIMVARGSHVSANGRWDSNINSDHNLQVAKFRFNL